MIASASSPEIEAPLKLPRVVIDGLVHRGELAGLELTEATGSLARTGIVAGLAFAVALLSGFAATFAVAAAVWERPDRGLIMALVALAYLAVAAGLSWIASRRLKSWRPFSETTRQLREDCACIQDHFEAVIH
jgi:uncharacterized membrane protein YqjE